MKTASLCFFQSARCRQARGCAEARYTDGMKASSFGGIFGGLARISGALARWFPMPKALFPPAAGVDVSDSSIKWMVLGGSGKGKRVHSFGNESIAEGIVENGIVRDIPALAKALG